MRPDELALALGGAHAACDAAWRRVAAAADALREPHDAEVHKERWEAFEAATAKYDEAVHRLATLTRQLLPAVTTEARDAAA